jgi:hypothetical protein
MDNLRETPEYVTVPRPQLMLIDKIVEMLKNNETGRVESENDWKAVVLMFELFKLEHPRHYEHFLETIKQFRIATIGNKGIIKDDSGDMVQHVLEVPETFHGYIHSMFPNQKWDKNFTNKLSSELPIFRVHGTM